MKAKKTGAVSIFVGVLLIVVFVVGLILEKNPSAFMTKYRYDYTLEQFCVFCRNWWLPAGIVGIPLFLISLIVNLVRESKENKN